MGLNVSITGLDKLQRELEDAQRAFQSLDGTITTLMIDPDNPASIDTAMRQMETAIDDKTRRYRGNALVESVAKGLKEHYRKAILERVARERSSSTDEPK